MGRPFVLGFVLALAFGASLVSVRPHVVERWGLYLGSPQRLGSAHLFLDPFPTAYSCETRVRAFTANAEPSFCAARRELEFGSSNDTILAADFNPFSRAAWFCLPRWGTRVASLDPLRGGAPRR